MTNPAAPPRALPGLERQNRAYWTGGAEGLLLIGRCGACQVFVHPPLPRCPACGDRNVEPEAVSGRGRVASFSINHQAWLPGLPVPYVFAAVELEEQTQLYVFTNIINSPVDQIEIGMPVEVTFEAHEDVHLPMFQPRGGAR